MAPFDFEKLYNDARIAVERSGSEEGWKKYDYTDPKVWEKDFRNGQTDLYWLSTELLNLALVESTHRPITDDFFIKKNPYKEAKSYKECIGKQSTVKNRLLLYPRGTFKSSIDMADVIQWIVCFPNIRVIYMTAEETLATDFVRQTKSYFQIPESTTMTKFQMLYFSHCIPAKKKEAENQFLSPARTEQQAQPTLLSLSLGMSTAGKHSDVAKFDDCVSNTNSGPRANAEQRKKVTDEIKLARPLVDLYGFRDFIGTPYDPADAYASIQESMAGPDLKVLTAPAWTVKPGARKKSIEQLNEDDVELLFPIDGQGVERLTFKALMSEYRSDSFIFSCQYMINPALTRMVKFTEYMLRKLIVAPEDFPQPGSFFTAQAWDFAVTDGSSSDRSFGANGQFVTQGPLAGRLYVTDVVRGRFGKSELPFQVANLANRWKPLEKLGIEKSPGADFLENDITRAMIKVGYSDCPPIEWIPVDNQKGAKNARAEGLETLYLEGRILFSSAIPEDVMDEVIKEHLKFKAGSNRKDDSLDGLAHLTRYIPKNIVIPQTEQEKQTAAWDLLKQKQQHERMFPPNEDKQTPTWKRDGYDRQEPIAAPLTHWEGMPILRHSEEPYYGT
jgi:phage terminase large subunit-like protein